MSKKALVLSGGSIKGAFQAGAIKDILTSGTFQPDVIYGTSVGCLNGAFIAERAGRAVAAGSAPNWIQIANELEMFWLKNINSFEKIGSKKSGFSLLFNVLFKKFDGFIDTKPLRRLVRKTIDIQYLKKSPIDFFACSVNLKTSKAVYADAKNEQFTEDMYDYIIASTAIPMVMPVRMIREAPFVDGGIREIAPLSQAINDGATEIYCIVCQPKELNLSNFNRKNAIKLMERETAIVSNETVNNDIDRCFEVNEILRMDGTNGFKNKRHIDLTVVRPLESIKLDLEKFDTEQIRSAMKNGWERSQEERGVNDVRIVDEAANPVGI